MDFIEQLEQEHEDIERELLELEFIMNEDEEINYSNLRHTFAKLCDVWEVHEEKEERIFPVMKQERIVVPVEKMLMDHVELRPHKEAIDNAIRSGSQTEMKKALSEHGKVMIDKFRKHMDDEEKILFAITIEVFTPEEISEIDNSLEAFS